MKAAGGLAGVLADAGRRIADVLSPRGDLVERLRTLRAKHDAEGAARAKAIAAAQAEVDKLDEPRRRLEQLRADALGAGLAADREIGALENELRNPEGWPRELKRLALDLERFHFAWNEPIRPLEEHNRVTGGSTLLNSKDFELQRGAIEVWMRATIELRDRLWGLPPAALHTRIGEIRHELAKFDRDGLGAGETGEE